MSRASGTGNPLKTEGLNGATAWWSARTLGAALNWPGSVDMGLPPVGGGDDAGRVDPINTMLPVAAALAVAVADLDKDAVASILTPLDMQGLSTLAVALAAHVNLDRPMTAKLPPPLTPANAMKRAVNIAAEMFCTTPEGILGKDRSRPNLDARAVAQAALRLVGLSSTAIGEHFGRDHSTVLYSAGRVGESARLRGLSRRVAFQCGWDRDDEEGAAGCGKPLR